MNTSHRRIVFLLAGVAVLVYLTVRLGPLQILSMLERIGWAAPRILIIYVAYQACRAGALALAVPRPGVVTLAEAFSIRLSGEAVDSLTFSGPFFAEPAKAWLLQRRGLTLGEGFASTLTEYLVYSFIAAAMSVAAMVWLLVKFPLTGGLRAAAFAILVGHGLFLAASFTAIAARFYLIGTIIQGVSRLPIVRQRLRPDMNAVNRMEDLLLAVLRDSPRRLLAITMIELVAHALQLFELYVIMSSFQLAFSLSTVFLVEGASKFTSPAFFFIPGEIGAAEGVYAMLFEIVGLPAAAGFAVPFVRRIRSLVVSAVGIAAFSRSRT